MAKTSATNKASKAKPGKARVVAGKTLKAGAARGAKASPARAKTAAKTDATPPPRESSKSRAAVRAKAAARGSRLLAGSKASDATAIDAQVLAHGLHDLLHTMQIVQQHEEALCSLMHALRRGRAGASLLRDLRGTLRELPAHDYLSEVEALREAVAG